MKNPGQGVAPEALAQDRESVREFISIAVHDLRRTSARHSTGIPVITAPQGDNSEESRDRGARYLRDGVARIETLIQDIAEYCCAEVRELEHRATDLEMSLLEPRLNSPMN